MTNRDIARTLETQPLDDIAQTALNAGSISVGEESGPRLDIDIVDAGPNALTREGDVAIATITVDCENFIATREATLTANAAADLATLIRDLIRSLHDDPTETARELGRAAFHAGRPCTPALDADLMNMLTGVRVGSGAPILEAWTRGWTEANLATPA